MMFSLMTIQDNRTTLVEINCASFECEEGEVLVVENVSQESLLHFRTYLEGKLCIQKLTFKTRDELKRIANQIGPKTLLDDLSNTASEETAFLKMFKSKMKI
jgi:hypothetical protein